MADPAVLVPASFDVLWSAAVAIIGIGAVVVVVLVVRNAGRLVRHGIDPTTVEAEVAARLLQSQALAPAVPAEGGAAAVRSVEERLAELDALHARGVISEEERAAARARVLTDL